ncbi:DUF1801 domain-containing protein [Hylemonella gracilis]|uniref:DUF1801 domain-containing protein n=1 Tax=Hylemonella gracilis TaxID=80880 RepID=A0A4P6UNF2_9BURK|nr:DUF1801 domain-containing protein [Hylemonella gracilis]QBK06154.1 DUF1801 domain-containing protein [Hylemonella gracilis]
MTSLFMLPDARAHDPAIDVWLQERVSGPDPALGALAQHWFQVLRDCGDDVRELLHDGMPTACVGQAAFAHVAAYKAHVNVGFFRGAALLASGADPVGLLEGSGRSMRHVKLRSEDASDEATLRALIQAAYEDVRRQTAAQAPP